MSTAIKDFESAIAELETIVKKLEQGDLFQADLSKATVITMFLMPWINMKLRPKILDMKPGTRVVSHAFDMGEPAVSPDKARRLAGDPPGPDGSGARARHVAVDGHSAHHVAAGVPHRRGP